MNEIEEALSKITDPLDRFLGAIQAMSIASRISSRITEAMNAAPERKAELEAADEHAVQTISAAHIEAKKALVAYIDQRLAEVLGRKPGN
jgi:hypothetical protein